jgi:hypothetical protein
MKRMPIMEARTAGLLIAFAVGLGIAVHPFFFLVALAIFLVAIMEWTTEKLGEYLQTFRRAYPHA